MRMKKKIITLGILSASSVSVIHILNRVYYFFSTSKDMHSSFSNQFYKWRFGEIKYRKKGSGTPLLFVHDLTVGSSGYEFHKLIDNLTDTHEIYTLDLLGYGMSEKPSMTYTNNLYEQLITDFIRNVIKRRTSVVVTGDSVPFIIIACHNNPEYFDKLILINPQSLYKQNLIPSTQTKFLKLVFEIPILGTFFYNILNSKNTIQKTFTKEYFYNPEKIKKNYILNYLEASQIHGCNAKYSFASYLGKFTNSSILHALKEINNSILIIGGAKEEDIETIIENYKFYNSAIEDVYIPQTKHLPHMEMPDDVLDQFKIFLS